MLEAYSYDTRLHRRYGRFGATVGLLVLAVAIASGEPTASSEVTDGPTYMYSSKQVEQPLRTTLTWTNLEQHGVLLPDGRVAMFMGREDSGVAFFDPKTESILYKKHASPPYSFKLGILPDEKVLVLDRLNSEVYDVKKDEYDPVDGPFPNKLVWHCGYCLLPDGRYFFSGSFDQNNVSDVCSYYDPKLNIFATTGKLVRARGGHSATWIGNDQILIAGGHSKDHDKQSYDSLEIFDISTGTSRILPATMKYARAGHGAIRLKDGTVLIVGGQSIPANKYLPPAEAELFDPKSQTVSAAGTLARARRSGFLASLPSGRVAVFYGYEYSRLVEIYVPETRSFVLADQLTLEPRGWADTEPIVLQDGRILNVGFHGDIDDKEIVAKLEIFKEEKLLHRTTIPADAAQWLKDLGAENFSVRQTATEKLSKRAKELHVWIEPFRDSADLEVKLRVENILGAQRFRRRENSWTVELWLSNGQVRTVTLADSKVSIWAHVKDIRVTQILAAAAGEKIDELVVRFPKSYSYQTQGFLFELAGFTWVPRVVLGLPLPEYILE